MSTHLDPAVDFGSMWTSPWLLLLIRPRQAIHELLAQPTRTTRLGFVLMVYAALTALSTVVLTPPQQKTVPLVLTWILLVLGFGLLTLICTLVARLLGGRAPWKRQLWALVWGQLPAFVMLLILVVVGALSSPAADPVVVQLRTGLNIVGLVWSTGTTALTMAEVNGWKGPRGLGVALVPFLFGVLNYLPGSP